MRKLFKVLTVPLVAVLVACGGGGGNSGTTPGAIVSPSVASFDYQIDKAALTNSGLDDATLTITALDDKNNPVANAPVSVTVDSGIYTPTAPSTDASGKASGKISVGSNKGNRNINYTMTVGGQTKTGVIAVTGTTIDVTTVPAAPSPGSKVTVTVKVADVNGAGIANASVKLGGSLGFTQSLKTASNGIVTESIPAAPAAGLYTVTASGAGVVVSRDVLVVGDTGVVAPVTESITAASLAITPNTIARNQAGATTNRSTLRALFQNASNQAIKNVRVRFEIMAPGLGNGEQISTGNAVVYSNESGVATAEYISGSRTSPTNGVRIRACYGSTDAELANGACPNQQTATLTVASSALSITLGENNELEKGQYNLTYIKKLDVAVSDAAGNAVSGAQISASVDLIRYGKGAWQGEERPTTAWWCLNEDKNRNGVIDAGEDIDNDGQLEPRKADVVISYLGGQVTGSNGRATLQVEYPQNVGSWIEYVVKVTTSVAGSEGTYEKSFVTDVLEADVKNGSFRVSPFGVIPSCTNPN